MNALLLASALAAAPLVQGVEDPALGATVLACRELRYRHGPLPSHDLPGHVRAGSGLTWSGGRLVVAQDDALALALVDPRSGWVTARPLPAGPDGARTFSKRRGNKAIKPDLEAVAEVDGRLLAFGSGSTPARERILELRAGSPARFLPAHSLYGALRERADFAGSELNIEGAARLGDRLHLLQRGNGAPARGLEPIDAGCSLDLGALEGYLRSPGKTPPPAVRNVTRYRLGALDGVRLTFTDAAAAGPRMLFLAAAEDSPDTYRDGPVAGAALGLLVPGRSARWARLRKPDGTPFDGKAEGVTPDRRDPDLVWVVLDRDAPDLPAELCEVRLRGPWGLHPHGSP